MASIEKIKELLGNGLSNEIVASTIGVHPSYISQLMSDEDFYNDVVELRTQALAANTVRDRSLDSLEDRLIEKLDEAISERLIYKPNEILRAFQVINSAKRRGVSSQESTVINNTIVTLSIPKTVTREFVTNKVGEVIEVEGQTMITMPASALLQKLAAEKTGAQADKYRQVHNFLPEAAKQATTDALMIESSQGNPEVDANGKRTYKNRQFEHQQRRIAADQAEYDKLKTGINLRDLT